MMSILLLKWIYQPPLPADLIAHLKDVLRHGMRYQRRLNQTLAQAFLHMADLILVSFIRDSSHLLRHR